MMSTLVEAASSSSLSDPGLPTRGYLLALGGGLVLAVVLGIVCLLLLLDLQRDLKALTHPIPQQAWMPGRTGPPPLPQPMPPAVRTPATDHR